MPDHSFDKEGINGHEPRTALCHQAPGAASSSWAEAWGPSVTRLLGPRGATIVNAQNSMLFTPMLPELAAGIVEVRNVMTPLAMVCPHAEVITGRVTDLTLGDGRAEIETDGGLRIGITYDHVVIGVGAVPRTFPVPGLTEHAVGSATVLDALYLRNQLLRVAVAAALEPGSRPSSPVPHLCLRRWRLCRRGGSGRAS